VKVSADMIVAAIADFFQELVLPLPDAQLLRRDGVAAVISGVPVPVLNPVLLERPGPKVADFASLLDEVELRALPYSLGLRPGSGGALAELAASRGMTAEEGVPLMVVNTVREIQGHTPPPAVQASGAAAGIPGSPAAPPFPTFVRLPADQAAHPDAENEWWYVTGRVEAGGHTFGYEVQIKVVGVMPLAAGTSGFVTSPASGRAVWHRRPGRHRAVPRYATGRVVMRRWGFCCQDRRRDQPGGCRCSCGRWR
jgi:hypothetical protein